MEQHQQAGSRYPESSRLQQIGQAVANIMSHRGRSASKRARTARQDEPTISNSRTNDGYVVSSGDWPAHIQRDTLSVDELMDALDFPEEVYDLAMNGLQSEGEAKPTVESPIGSQE